MVVTLTRRRCARGAMDTGVFRECARGPNELAAGSMSGAAPPLARRLNYPYPAMLPSRINAGTSSHSGGSGLKRRPGDSEPDYSLLRGKCGPGVRRLRTVDCRRARSRTRYHGFCDFRRMNQASTEARQAVVQRKPHLPNPLSAIQPYGRWSGEPCLTVPSISSINAGSSITVFLGKKARPGTGST
jgi:hypothetical protein